MKRDLKKLLGVTLVSILLCFMSICVLSGCGDNSDSDYDNTESTYDSDYDENNSDNDSSYDDWDTDNNGEADWQDVDTDNDGNVSQDEMQDYVEDWEGEENGGDYNNEDDGGGKVTCGEPYIPENNDY